MTLPFATSPLLLAETSALLDDVLFVDLLSLFDLLPLPLTEVEDDVEVGVVVAVVVVVDEDELLTSRSCLARRRA